MLLGFILINIGYFESQKAESHGDEPPECGAVQGGR